LGGLSAYTYYIFLPQTPIAIVVTKFNMLNFFTLCIFVTLWQN